MLKILIKIIKFTFIIKILINGDPCTEFPENWNNITECCNIDYNSLLAKVLECPTNNRNLNGKLEDKTATNRICTIMDECFIKSNKIFAENNSISTDFLKEMIKERIENKDFIESYNQAIDYCVKNLPINESSDEHCPNYGVDLFKCINFVNYFRYCPDKYWSDKDICLKWKEYYQTCTNGPQVF